MTANLPTWIERLLGIDAASSGEGTVLSLDSSWPWAPWLTLLLVIFSVIYVLAIYLHEGGEASRRLKFTLAGMRLCLMGIIALMIAELALSLQRTGLPYIAVIVDDSASMGVLDRYQDEVVLAQLKERLKKVGLEAPTRINLAKALLLENDGELLRGIEEKYKLKLYLVSGASREQSNDVDVLLPTIEALEPTGENTRLGQGLREVLNDLRGNPPAAIVLMSDGITTEGETVTEAAAYARLQGVALFTVALGNEEPLKDVELQDLLVDDVVFVDDVVNFEFKVTATGLAGQTVEAVLRQNDQSEPLARKEITLGPDGTPQTVRLPYRPRETGEFEYVIEVEPLEDEVSADNNRLSRVVSVRKEQLRVLYVQSYPNFEFRYLKHLLERDSTIELHTVLQEADPEYAEQDRSALRVFPIRREDLFRYDTILFGDVNPVFLTSSVMATLADFVTEKGGGMAFLAGPSFTPAAYRNTPLGELLPIDFQPGDNARGGVALKEGFRLQPTDLGLASGHMQLGDSPAESLEIWQNLPPLFWFYEATALKPAARVLAVHPSHLDRQGRPLPMIVDQYAGAGKVLFHATDETWRWRYRVGDVYLARYWVQTIRYLSRSKLLGRDRTAELTANRREYQRGESVRLRARFLDERLAPVEDDGVTLVIEQQGKKKRRITLHRNKTSRGIFEGVMGRPALGKYHAWIATPNLEGTAPSTDFLVTAPPGEFQRVQIDAAAMKQAATMTKGRDYRFDDASQLLDDLPRGRQVPIESLPNITLWNRWPLLAVFLGLLVSEWMLRKRKGLL